MTLIEVEVNTHMRIQQLFENIEEFYHTSSEDNSSQKLTDVRKTRLTLKQIKKLREMNDIKKYEQELKFRSLNRQYKPSQPQGMPAM